MAKVRVLVVEDEESIQALIRFTLEQAGFGVESALSAEEARTLLAQELPDVVLLDWMLPGASGVQLAKQLRQDERSKDLPIILLTARSEDTDKELGLNQGADDYLTKPFSPRELIARINALLRRRAPQKTSEVIEVKGLLLDPAEQRVYGNGQPVSFGPTEFKLLHFFMTHPRARIQPPPIVGFGVGRSCVCGRAHGRCAHPPPAPCAGAQRLRPLCANRARCGLPLLA